MNEVLEMNAVVVNTIPVKAIRLVDAQVDSKLSMNSRLEMLTKAVLPGLYDLDRYVPLITYD